MWIRDSICYVVRVESVRKDWQFCKLSIDNHFFIHPNFDLRLDPAV